MFRFSLMITLKIIFMADVRAMKVDYQCATVDAYAQVARNALGEDVGFREEYFNLWRPNEEILGRRISSLTTDQSAAAQKNRPMTFGLSFGKIFNLLMNDPKPFDPFTVVMLPEAILFYCKDALFDDHKPTCDPIILYQRALRIQKSAEVAFGQVEALLQDTDLPIVLIGHLSGTAVSHLVLLELSQHRNRLLCIGFGLYRLFSPEFIAQIKDICKYCFTIVGVEQFLPNNFGLTGVDLGELITLKSSLQWKSLINSFDFGDQEALYKLARLIKYETSEKYFAEMAPSVLTEHFSTHFNDPHCTLSPGSSILLNPSTKASIKRNAAQGNTAVAVSTIEASFTMTFLCLRDAKAFELKYQICRRFSTCSDDDGAVDYYFTIKDKASNASIDFRVRIFPAISSEQEAQSFLKQVHTERIKAWELTSNSVGTHNLLNWAVLFRNQYRHLPESASSIIKRMHPFFEESIFQTIPGTSIFFSLILEPYMLLNKLRSSTPDYQRFIQNIFGPVYLTKEGLVRKGNFIGFQVAQEVLMAPLISDRVGYLNSSLMSVVRGMFKDNDFHMKDLLKEEEVIFGQFSFKCIAKFNGDELNVPLSSKDVSIALNAPDQLRSCNHGLIGKQCPYLSLSTPTNPFWKRIMRIYDTYLAFTGSHSFTVTSQPKYAQIMALMGPEVMAHMKAEQVGAFAVFEIYSNVLGFGPGSRQGLFYMLIIQDPPDLP